MRQEFLAKPKLIGVLGLWSAGGVAPVSEKLQASFKEDQARPAGMGSGRCPIPVHAIDCASKQLALPYSRQRFHIEGPVGSYVSRTASKPWASALRLGEVAANFAKLT